METNAPLRAIMADLEKRARADFDTHTGRVILATTVAGYIGNDSVEIHCNPPARLRVCGSSGSSLHEDLTHWNDNWLDPYWDVELAAPHPALTDARSLWTFGPSYCTDGRTEPCSEWTLEPAKTLWQSIITAVTRA